MLQFGSIEQGAAPVLCAATSFADDGAKIDKGRDRCTAPEGAHPSVAMRSEPRKAHVIVCGNEKGGSGKSTIAIHLAIALLKEGCSVATIDLDSRQRTLTRYLENRKRSAALNGLALAIPKHLRVERSERTARDAADAHEREELAKSLAGLSPAHDFVVIDTPGFDTGLSRAAHALSDTLVTPMNDSFIDYDVLARIDPATGAFVATSQYAEQVSAARRARAMATGAMLDWTIVRNRLSNFASGNEKRVHESLRQLGTELGFRLVDGITERVIYRELFHEGLTVLDDLELALPDYRSRSTHRGAAADIRSLVDSLQLPLDARRREREAARSAWLQSFRRARVEPPVFAE